MSLLPREAGKTRPKVVRIIGRLNVGGPARLACLLHEQLADEFDTRLIIGSLGDGESDMSYLLHSERNVLRVPQMSRRLSFFSDLAALWRIFRFLRHERPDVVHTHTAKAGALGRLAAWLARVPIIVHTYHGHVFHGYFSGWMSRAFVVLERMLSRFSTSIVAISKSQKTELSAKYKVAPPEKIAVIPNGLLLEQFSRARREDARNRLGLAASDFVALWAGRMVPVKDLPLLAGVVKRSQEVGANISFLVVGDGPERAEFERLVEGCRNIQLLGWRHDMDSIWPAADVAILTSLNEGTPTSLIEAMAAGVPFVATNVGGVQDLAKAPLHALECGLGYKAANGFLATRTPEALLHCIETIAKDCQAARTMGTAGRKLAFEQFSAARMLEDTATMYWILLTGTMPCGNPTVYGNLKASDSKASTEGS
jgi:glycosyltransferase involved in cell wall biosynthesis